MATNIKNRLKALLGRSYDFYLVYAAAGFVIVMLIALIIGMVGRSGKIAGYKQRIQESSENVSKILHESVMTQIETLHQLSL